MSRRLLAGLLVAGLLAAAVVASPRRAIALARGLADDPWRLALVVCVLTVVRPFLAWPTTALSGVIGFGYGLWGVPFAVAAVTVTSLPPYLLGERGQTALADGDGRLAAATARLSDGGDRAVSVVGPFRSIAVARLAPLPSDVVSVAAGVTGVPLRGYLAGTAIGELPWVIAAVAAAASAKTLTTEGLSAVDPRLVGVAVLLAVVLLAGPALERLRSA